MNIDWITLGEIFLVAWVAPFLLVMGLFGLIMTYVKIKRSK